MDVAEDVMSMVIAFFQETFDQCRNRPVAVWKTEQNGPSGKSSSALLASRHQRIGDGQNT
jgi:hypothetical protein